MCKTHAMYHTLQSMLNFWLLPVVSGQSTCCELDRILSVLADLIYTGWPKKVSHYQVPLNRIKTVMKVYFFHQC